MTWYLTPQALPIIAGLKATPPQRVFERDRYSRNYHDGHSDYHGAGVDALRDLFRAEAAKIESDVPAWKAIIHINADEVLAALFGDPNGLDWAHPDRTARRAAMAVEIDAALAMQVAA